MCNEDIIRVAMACVCCVYGVYCKCACMPVCYNTRVCVHVCLCRHTCATAHADCCMTMGMGTWVCIFS